MAKYPMSRILPAERAEILVYIYIQCMDGMEKWNVYIEYEIGNNNYIKIYKMAKHPMSKILPTEQVKILEL